MCERRSIPEKNSFQFDLTACLVFRSRECNSFGNLKPRFPLFPKGLSVPRRGVACRSCLGVWTVDLEVTGLPGVDSNCDLDNHVVRKSIFGHEICMLC